MIDDCVPPSSTGSLASQFRVFCVKKPKHSINCSGEPTPASTSAPTPLASQMDAAAPISYLDVVQQLDGGGGWSFAPYPPCSRVQLLQVHAYWVAMARVDAAGSCGTVGVADKDSAANMQQKITTSSKMNTEQLTPTSSYSCDKGDTSVANSLNGICVQRLACVVGIVWVRLSASTGSTSSLVKNRSSRNSQDRGSQAANASCNTSCSRRSNHPSVEGYIQVVITHEHYRRRGLASWLLEHCLACQKVAADVFAFERGDGVAYLIQRWHLHTLAAGRRPQKRCREDSTSTQEYQRTDMGSPHHHPDTDQCESDRENSIAIVDATLAMYHRLGFQERRYLTGYYARRYDAVELMRGDQRFAAAIFQHGLRRAKWLAFFAELTAKLTHHNALVVMEGAELLKRLLLSRVSIAAVLQQGDLLLRLFDAWRGCVLAERPRASLQQHEKASPTRSPPPPPSAAIALNDELSFVLAESISQCIDLMVSLHADGDTYYSLLVLARAGPMLETLVDVMRMAPPQLYGITASLLQQLLALPLGSDSVGCVGGDNTEGKVCVDGAELFLDKTTVTQLRESIPLQRHVRSLVEAVQEHGALLQCATDTLAGLLAVQQGPRRLAAISLFNQASRRLGKHYIRHGRASHTGVPPAAGDTVLQRAPSSDFDPREVSSENFELNVTITGAAPARTSTTSPSPNTATPPCALDDIESGLRSSAKRRLDFTVLLPGEAEEVISTAAAAARSEISHLKGARVFLSPPVAGSHAESENGSPPSQPPDISAMVDGEPQRLACSVPPDVVEETLQHLASSDSHDAFFDAFDWLWCLTVADASTVGAALTPEMLHRCLGRYLTAAPRTRRDRVLFTLLLLWVGHVHSVSALRQDTHSCILEVAASALLPMLRAELSENGDRELPGQTHNISSHPINSSLTVSAITPSNTNIAGMVNATILSTQVPTGPLGYGDMSAEPTIIGPSLDRSSSYHGGGRGGGMLPNESGSALLPYATARKAQEMAVLLRPSIGVILLSFLLNIHTGAAVHTQRLWISQGRVLEVTQMAVHRGQGCRSVLLDTPTSIDGSLSDEVYLECAQRSVRTDASTVAVLGCRLVAAVLGDVLRWGAAACDDSGETTTAVSGQGANENGEGKVTEASMQAELSLFAQSLIPRLVDMAVSNPDVAAVQEGGAASPVHHVPLNLRCSRYTSLGECALVALDACLQYHAQGGHLRTRGEVPMCVSHFALEDLLRALPKLTCVSHCSVHPPVRAVPYRLLIYASRRLEEVLTVLRHMPSLASAAVSCVLDYGPRAAQWEAAAAAEWLTVVIKLLMDAETPKQKGASSRRELAAASSPPRRRLPTTAELLNEYFHFDDSPLSRKLLATIAVGRRSTSTGSAYAVNALLQLAIHLQTYLQARRRRRGAPHGHKSSSIEPSPSPPGNVTKESTTVEEPATLPLCPAGALSTSAWVGLLQSITADNRRLTRICSAFKHSSDASPCVSRWGGGGIARDASMRALTAAEQIALQYSFTGTLFRALEELLQDAVTKVQVASLGTALLSEAVAAALKLPTPPEVVALLSKRFQAALAVESGCGDVTRLLVSWAPPSALVLSYQVAIEWASRVGTSWLMGSYVNSAKVEGDVARGTRVHCSLFATRDDTALVEDICLGALSAMREMSPSISQRARCLAASLVSAVVDACPIEKLGVLEASGAALFAACVSLRRLPCVSGLQCRLLRRVRSAAVYATTSSNGWVDTNIASLKRIVACLKENVMAASNSAKRGGHSSVRRSSPQQTDANKAARELQYFQVLVSLLTSLVSCTGVIVEDSAQASNPATGDEKHNTVQPQLLLTADQRQTLCAVLCDAMCVEQLQSTVVRALRSMCDTYEGRCCILAEIASTGDPLGRTLFGRLLALMFHMPSRWAGADSSSSIRSSSCANSLTRTPQNRSRCFRSASPPLRSAPYGEAALSTERDIVGVVGCDVCAALCALRFQVDTENASSISPTASVFLSTFMKHRGVEYLARAVVECDRDLRCHGRELAVPLHWLRLVAALSSHVSIAKLFLQESDLFSVLLELAGAPASSSHAAAATLALLAIRNVCFTDSLKSALCQDARVLLTLKAAGMRLTTVSQLIEWRPQSSPTLSSKRPVTTPPSPGRTGGTAVTSRGGACPEVMLRDDVIDLASKTEVDWAKQMCVYARGLARLGEEPLSITAGRAHCDTAGDASVVSEILSRAVLGCAPGGGSAPAVPRSPRLLGDGTSRSRALTMDSSLLEMDTTVCGGSPAQQAEADMLPLQVIANDSEAHRRRYLAATAIASLWFDNQRGRSAIARVLATAPCWSIEDVQEAAKAPASQLSERTQGVMNPLRDGGG